MKKKRVRWFVGLYPYHFSDKNVVVPRVQLRGTVTLEHLAGELERRTGIYRRENVRAIVSIMESIIEDYLVEGYAVSGNLGTLTPTVTGIWNYDRFLPDARAQNKAVARYTMSPQLKKTFADPLFRKAVRRTVGPVVSSVYNPAADEEERAYWLPGDYLILRGSFLLMNGEDDTRGVYFVDVATDKPVAHVSPDDMYQNARSRILLRIPPLPDGCYRLRVVSQCTTSPRPLRKPHASDTRSEWMVGDQGQTPEQGTDPGA